MMATSIDERLNEFLASPVNVIAAALATCWRSSSALLYFDQAWFYVKMIVKSLRRNVLRSTLTTLATIVLVLVVTMVWTVIYFLDLVTQEKSQDFKVIVTERWQILADALQLRGQPRRRRPRARKATFSRRTR